jgi:deoxyribose-phosphate aldolase
VPDTWAAGSIGVDVETLRGNSVTDPVPADTIELLVRCIDLTSLEPDDTREKILALCERAVRPDPDDERLPSVAAVCVFPQLVPTARQAIAETGVLVAAATGAFPSGRAPMDQRLDEIRSAIELGAQEIDSVLDYRALLDGRREHVLREVAESKRVCGEITLKVILETGALGSADVVFEAALLAADAGADYLKSSTGKIPTGATPGAAAAMAAAIRAHRDRTGRRVGLKVSGGIRRPEQAATYLDLVREDLGEEWCTPSRFRIGASSLLDALVAERRREVAR